MPASATLSPPTSATTGYVPIAASVLRCLDASDLDVYFWNDRADRVVLFRDSALLLSHEKAGALSESCADVLYVRTADFAALCDRILESLEDVMAATNISPTARFEVLQTAVSLEIEKSLRAIRPEHYVTLVQRVGKQISTLISNDGVLPRDLFDIARHDSQTFTHVTNVAGYAVVLAERLGITDREQLDQIAVGGMLHDIGKRHISSAILTKPASLTVEEREIIQTHPQLGYEELCAREDVNDAQLMMVYQHHEHINGKGYPVGILGEEMHPWSRLLAVVDVFDALTGKRPYRRPMSMGQAAKFISDRKGTQFDEEMATCWIAAIESK